MIRKITWFYSTQFSTGVIAITIDFYHKGQSNKLFNFHPNLQYTQLT